MELKPLSDRSTAYFSTLLLRPQRYPDESTLGFVLRVAEDNSIPHTHWLFDAAEISINSLVRICPICVGAKGAFWPASWYDALQPWCQAHAAWLVDLCSACGRRYRGRAVSFSRCLCRHALSDKVPIPVAREVIEGAERFGMRSMYRLGLIARFGFNTCGKAMVATESMIEVRETLVRGAELVTDWPQALKLHLRGVRRETDNPGPQKVSHAWPGLTNMVAKLKQAELRTSMQSAIQELVDESQSSQNPLFGRNFGITNRLMSVTKAAKNSGIAGSRFRRAIAAVHRDKQILVQTKSGRSRGALSWEEGQAVRYHLDDQISYSAAASLLGLLSPRISELAFSGRLQLREGLLSRAGCMTLADSYCTLAQACPTGTRTTALREAFRIWITVPMTDKFLSAVESKALSIFRAGVNCRMGDLRFLHSDLIEWRRVALRPPDEFVQVEVAARRLNLKSEVAYDLVKAGLLRTSNETKGVRSSRLISVNSISEFQREFAPLATYARASSVYIKEAYDWAVRAGFEVVTGPKIDGRRQYFVRRPVTKETNP